MPLFLSSYGILLPSTWVNAGLGLQFDLPRKVPGF
jgi:hypothetical protein